MDWTEKLYWLLAFFFCCFVCYWIGYYQHWKKSGKLRKLLKAYQNQAKHLRLLELTSD